MKMKIINIGVILAGGFLAACKPMQKDPPFNANQVRQDVKVDGLSADAIKGPASIGANELWKKTTGKTVEGNRIRIAVIGTGIDYTNADLRDSLWINQGEMGENKWQDLVDNDGSGFSDDLFGYDFYSGDGLPYDWHGHDTYTASIIVASARTNAKVVGVAPNAELMVLRYLGPDGGVNRDNAGFDAAIAMDYAVDQGAKVIYFNWPEGGFSKSQTSVLMASLKKAELRNVLVVMPAGNSSNRGIPAFIQEVARMKNTLVVSGVDANGKLTQSTNSGRLVANVAAPVEAKGYYPGSVEANDLRTSSVAAAYVTGAAALMMALPQMASASRVKDAMMLQSLRSKDGEAPIDVLSEGVIDISKF